MMAAVTCLLLLLSYSVARQITPSALSLVTGWQDGQIGATDTGKRWLYDDFKKTPPLVRSPGIRGNDELDEVLVRRTSSRSPSHRRWSAHLQSTGLQQAPPSQMGALPAPHFQGGDHSRLPALGMVTPSPFPADGPVAPHIEPRSSSKRPHKPDRRPYGSLTNNPALKAQADRKRHALAVQRIKDGEQTSRMKPDGTELPATTLEDYQARTRANSKRWFSSLTKERKAKLNQRRNERRKRATARRRAQREGGSWQGPPVRKPGRPRRNWEQEQARAEEGRQHAPTDARMERATQRAPPGAQGSGTLRRWTTEPSSGSWSVTASPIPEATHHRFAPGPSSSKLDLRLLLSVPGSSTSEQRHAPQQAAPPAAETRVEERLRLDRAPPVATAREEERLRLTLAPPGEHDGLRLTLAPPKYD